MFILVALLAVLPYLNALQAGFTLDDIPNIRNNPAVTGGVDLTEIFATPLPLLAYAYRPFTVLTYAVNEVLTPGSAASFHLVNVALHAAVSILVFILGARLFDARVGAIAAALFAVHPIHTEAVTSIVGRAELLSTLFGLIALWAAAAMDTASGVWQRAARHALSVTCFVLALLSKESAVTLLPLIVLFRVTCRREPMLRGLWRELSSLDWVPYALCLGLFVALRVAVVGWVTPMDRLTPLDNPLGFVPWTVQVRSALGVLWDYFGLLNVPGVLSADYSYHQVPLSTSWLDPRFLGGLVMVATAMGVVACARRPGLRFVVVFPFLALLLTNNVVVPIGTVKAERLLYLPSVGWLLLVAVGLGSLLQTHRYRRIAAGVLIGMVMAFCARTWTRNWDWISNDTLFESMARTAPESAKARYNFGVALDRRGDHAAALTQFHEALAIAKWTEGAAFQIGLDFEQHGHVDEAIRWYTRALEIAPGYDEAHTNLCHVLVSAGRLPAAATACRNGLRYNPSDANLLKGLGVSLVGIGETEKGIAVLRRSLALNASDVQLEAYLRKLESTAPRPVETVMAP